MTAGPETDEENAKGGTNAPKRFMATIDGVLSPRGPIDVEQRADGKYLITDGNGTYTALKRYGWPAIPAIVHTAEATGFQRVQDIPVAQLDTRTSRT